MLSFPHRIFVEPDHVGVSLFLNCALPIICLFFRQYYTVLITLSSVKFSSVAQLCPTLCNAMNCSMPGHLSITNSQSLPKLMFIELVIPSNHLILCRPLLLLPSIFPSMRVFSNESALCIRWPKYWSFSFSISPSNEYSGLIFFRIDWFDLLAVQGTLKNLLPTSHFKSINSKKKKKKHQFFWNQLWLICSSIE